MMMREMMMYPTSLSLRKKLLKQIEDLTRTDASLIKLRKEGFKTEKVP